MVIPRSCRVYRSTSLDTDNNRMMNPMDVMEEISFEDEVEEEFETDEEYLTDMEEDIEEEDMEEESEADDIEEEAEETVELVEEGSDT